VTGDLKRTCRFELIPLRLWTSECSRNIRSAHRNTSVAIIIIIAVLIAIAALAWTSSRRRRSQRLRSHFRPEYDHAVRELGNRTKAEDALATREKRMEKIDIHPLSLQERQRFAARWHDVQTRFVDDPRGAIRDADALVNETMRARGYPMGEFEMRTENISVDRPQVVRNYRATHTIAVRMEGGEADAEALRHALVYYRDLFEELVEMQGGEVMNQSFVEERPDTMEEQGMALLPGDLRKSYGGAGTRCRPVSWMSPARPWSRPIVR
jgi:hypothetical protein